MGDIVVWADIPVADMTRAIAFYAKLTNKPVMQMPGMGDVAVIGDPATDGSLVSADLYLGGKPTHDGSTVYFGTDGDIDGMIARAVDAGGTVLQDKQDMGAQVGWIAFIEDTEGNRIGLQQPAA